MAVPRTAEALPKDLQARLEAAVRDADNPVAAVCAIRRVAARLPARYRGQRDALRWEAEKVLRPFWRDLTDDRGAKAAVWAALDGIWDTHTPTPSIPAERSGTRAAARKPAPRLERRLPDPSRAARARRAGGAGTC